MKSNFNLSIKSPCSEKWESFEKKDNKGYCSSCKKNVIDFTTYSDREIIEFFKKDNGNTCGRLRDDQLKNYEIEKQRSSSVNKIAAVVAASVLSLTQAQDAFAQTKDSVELKVNCADEKLEKVADPVASFPEVVICGERIEASPRTMSVGILTAEPTRKKNFWWPFKNFRKKKKYESKTMVKIDNYSHGNTPHSPFEFVRADDRNRFNRKSG